MKLTTANTVLTSILYWAYVVGVLTESVCCSVRNINYIGSGLHNTIWHSNEHHICSCISRRSEGIQIMVLNIESIFVITGEQWSLIGFNDSRVPMVRNWSFKENCSLKQTNIWYKVGWIATTCLTLFSEGGGALNYRIEFDMYSLVLRDFIYSFLWMRGCVYSHSPF